MLNISNLDKLPVAIGDESLVVGVTAVNIHDWQNVGLILLTEETYSDYFFHFVP